MSDFDHKKESEFYGSETSGLTTYQNALLRHCWFLAETERNILDKQFLLEGTAADIESLMIDVHPYKDQMAYKNELYDVYYLFTSDRYIQQAYDNRSDELFLISVRELKTHKINVMLIRPKGDYEPKYPPRKLNGSRRS